MEYGIGRIPADVDQTHELIAKITAIERLPRSEVVDCSNCGRATYRSNLMSASLGTACPDCYDDLSD